MKEENENSWQETARIILLCVFWYSMSSGGNVIGKIILTDFPYPMTVTMIQLLSISLYLGPILRLWDIPMPKEIAWSYYGKMIFPLAFGKFLNSVTAHISIWKVPVSYSHTVKATMPLFTVFLARLILKEKQTNMVYLSLVPIIGGVALATVTELSFQYIGLISALAATCGFSIQNIFSKKCLKDTGIHHLRLLLVLARIATIFFIPIWIVFDIRRIIKDESVIVHRDKALNTVILLLLDGFCSFGQNIAAFTVLAKLTTLSYAVANATKRVAIITVSIILLRNPVSMFNVLGMLTAVMGVLTYNKAKYDMNQAKRREQILPLVKSQVDLTQNHFKLPRSPTDLDFQNSFHLVQPLPGQEFEHMRNGGLTMYSDRNLQQI